MSAPAQLRRWAAATVLAALAVVLAGAAAREVELKAGETLATIARRELGDVKAVAELRALNSLPEDPAPGARIRLPGEERDRAVRAIAAARNALQQIDAGDLREQARARITTAERHLSAARYVEAATEADAAWKLLSSRALEQTRFTVAVSERGDTRVVSRSGGPARVEAQGVQRVAEPGQTVFVPKGSPPSEPAMTPLAPALTFPTPGAVLQLKPDTQGRLGPVRLVWSRSEHARAYEVQLVSAGGAQPLVFTSAENAIHLPPLAAGTYIWTVKALGKHILTSAPTEPWTFELRPQKLKLEVQGTKWK